MDIEFDLAKFKELMLYVAMKSADDPSFETTKLNKLLCLSDFYAYARLGRPITGATYRALEHGPGPRELDDALQALQEGGEAVVQRREQRGGTQYRLIPLRPADLSRFIAAEIALVDEIIEGVCDHRAGKSSLCSHRELVGWQIAAYDEDIPYAAVFLSAEPLTKAEMERAQAFATRDGWLADAR